MSPARIRILALALVVAAVAAAGEAWEPVALPPSSLGKPSSGVVLSDGRVLVIGVPHAASEERRAAIWDPGADRWTPAAVPPDGTWAGVRHGDGALCNALRTDAHDPYRPYLVIVLYHAGMDAWAPSDPIAYGFGYGGTLTRISDDSALVFGGGETSGFATSTPQVFRDGRLLSGPRLGDGRYNHVAVALADGRVLIAGGRQAYASPVVYADALLFSEATLDWDDAAVPDLPQPREGALGVLLGDGSVLIVGGTVEDPDHEGTSDPNRNAPIRWAPGASAWAATGAIPFAESVWLVALEPFADGGAIAHGSDGSVAIFDPTTSAWAAGPPDPDTTAPWLTLADGSILALDATPRRLRAATSSTSATLDVAIATVVMAVDTQPTLDGATMSAAGSGLWSGEVALPGAARRTVRLEVAGRAEREVDLVITEE